MANVQRYCSLHKRGMSAHRWRVDGSVTLGTELYWHIADAKWQHSLIL